MPEPNPTYSGNYYLNLSQMQFNAEYIWRVLPKIGGGWEGTTLAAMAAMLGNMETESTINPGIWEGLIPNRPKRGFGLVQWTPSEDYIAWCTKESLDPASMFTALLRIDYEINNGLQWIKTSKYPYSFKQFLKMTEKDMDIGEMAYMFMYNYERPADLNQPERKTQAAYWFTYLGGVPPDPPDPPDPPPKKGRKLPLIYYVRRK